MDEGLLSTQEGISSEAHDEVLVSIVLPVYNVEPYIDRCIASLRAQTLQELEFIFVDDCSQDNSMAAVEAWAKEDSRVRILRNDCHMGPASSRNRGIAAARGAYFSPIDPDDAISEDFCQLLYEAAASDDYDAALGSIHVVHPNRKSFLIRRPAEKIERGIQRGVPLFVLCNSWHTSAIYRRAIFEKFGTTYEGTNSEDILFLLRFMYHARTVTCNNEACYYYHKRPDSLVNPSSVKTFKFEMDAFEKMLDLLLETPDGYWQQKFIIHIAKWRLHLLRLVEREQTNTPSEIERCKRLFLQQLDRVPSIPPLYLFSSFPQIDILRRYGYVIPPYWHSLDDRRYDCLNQWTDFYAAHPDVRNSSYIRAFAAEVASHIAHYMKLRFSRPQPDTAEAKYAMSYLKKRLQLLSGKQRRAVYRALPKGFISFAVKKLQAGRKI